MLCANFWRHYDICCDSWFLSDAFDLASRLTSERIEEDVDVPWIPTGRTIRRDDGDIVRMNFADISAGVVVEEQRSQKAAGFAS